MNLDLSGYQAAIFDLDGTLVESEPVWQQAKRDVAAHFGVAVTDATLDALAGRRLSDFTAEVLADRLTDVDQQTRAEAMIMAHARAAMPTGIRPIDGAAALLETIHRAGLLLAICSSSPPEMIDSALDMLGVAGLITGTVSSASLAHGKPHPEPYLRTLELLKCAADRAIAFEDSGPGVLSATAAGLFTVGVGEAALQPGFPRCDIRFARLADIHPGGGYSAA